MIIVVYASAVIGLLLILFGKFKIRIAQEQPQRLAGSFYVLSGLAIEVFAGGLFLDVVSR